MWIGIALITVAAYRTIGSAPLVYEDANWSNQLTARHAPHVWGRFPGRGLTQWTWYQQATDGVPDVAAMHWGNVLIHLCCGGLVFLLARTRLVESGALVASAIFLWHPLSSQAVSYVSARTDLLMTFWILSAALLTRANTSWTWPAVLTCALLASVSKELGILSFALLLMIEGRWGWSLFLGIAVLPLIALVLSPPDWSVWGSLALANASGVWRVLSLMIVPYGLSFDPDPWAVPVVLRVVALIGLCMAAIWAWRRPERWVYGWLGVALVPRVLVPTFEPIHDHHAYLAMVPFALLGGAILSGESCARLS